MNSSQASLQVDWLDLKGGLECSLVSCFPGKKFWELGKKLWYEDLSLDYSAISLSFGMKRFVTLTYLVLICSCFNPRFGSKHCTLWSISKGKS